MLRWKIQFAICAIVMMACPLTAFAQQGVESPEIIIRSPFVQPHNPNLYLFVVENEGTVDATAATVDLYVPQNVTIANVVPAPETGSGQWARVRLTNLAAGSKSIIEVEISPTSNHFEFVTRMKLESVQTFTTATNPTYVARSIPDRIAPLTKDVATAKYLIPTAQASHESSRLMPLATVAAAASAVPASTRASVDAKLMNTVKSLRLAGQDALADAYIAAVVNSDSYRAETF